MELNQATSGNFHSAEHDQPFRQQRNRAYQHEEGGEAKPTASILLRDAAAAALNDTPRQYGGDVSFAPD